MGPTAETEHFIHALATEDGAQLALASKEKTPRKHHENFPVDKIVLIPEENYRWRTKEGMIADLTRKDTQLEDGTLACSYEMLRDSIAAMGVEEAIGLVEREDGFHVIFGFTRAYAAIETKRAVVPAYVYDSTIPEGEVQLLQMRENATGLKRAVNWVAEADQFNTLVAQFYDARTSKLQGEVPKAQLAAIMASARKDVCRLMGKHMSRIKSYQHFMHYLDKRVIELARNGVLSYLAASEFHSNNVNHLYPPEFITAVLKQLYSQHGENGQCPRVITPDQVRKAKVAVRAGVASGERANIDVGEESDEAPEAKGISMSRAARNLRAAGHETPKGTPGAVKLMSMPEKVRQSPAVLRDISDLIAWQAINDRKLSINSEADAAEELIESPEWHRIVGIGFGAGDVTVPPLMETVLKGRSKNDSEVESLQNQHDITAERYVLSAFISGFLRHAMSAAGVRNLDYDDKGWLVGSSKDADGKPVYHRFVWTTAINAASGPQARKMKLLDRAKLAWSRIKPYVKKAR